MTNCMQTCTNRTIPAQCHAVTVDTMSHQSRQGTTSFINYEGCEFNKNHWSKTYESFSRLRTAGKPHQAIKLEIRTEEIRQKTSLMTAKRKHCIVICKKPTRNLQTKGLWNCETQYPYADRISTTPWRTRRGLHGPRLLLESLLEGDNRD